MGTYDWNNKYDPNTKYTISGLARELMIEVEHCEKPTEDEITKMRKRLFNTANTGLGDRFKKYMNADLLGNCTQ